jgi:hypothetical protein
VEAGIRCDNQETGTTKNSEGKKGQQQGVEAGDKRSAGDPGVAKSLRNVHGGELDASQRVFDGGATSDRPYALEENEMFRGRSAGVHREPERGRGQGGDGAEESSAMIGASKLSGEWVSDKEGSSRCGNYHTL